MIQRAILELPERVSVETILIDWETASLQNITSVTHLSALTQNSSTSLHQGLPGISGIMTSNHPAPLKKTASIEVMTESNPTRSRCLQTEPRNENSIGIQCDLEKDLEDMNFEKMFDGVPRKTSKDNLAEIKEGFANFTKTNSKSYTNGKIECLQCGEINRNSKLMESHMAIHWGPSILCHRCGIQFEHKILWKHHNCGPKETFRLHRLKCPHYLCAADAISKAELFDHLNEHCGTIEYTCLSCSKGFMTAGELRYHIKLHRKCRNGNTNSSQSSPYNQPLSNLKYRNRYFLAQTLKGKRFAAKTFLSQIALKHSHSAPQLCNVCLKQSKNSFQHRRHVKHCLKEHKLRLQHKRWENTPNENSRTNGIN